MSTEKSLLLIVNEAVGIENMLIESGGEVTEEIEKALAVSSKDLSEKVDNYHLVLERFDALEKYYQSRSDFFKNISVQCRNVQNKLKNNIKFAMQTLNTTEIKGGDMRFVLSPSSGSLNIIDEEMVPLEFKKEVIVTEIDKKSLKDALKKGNVPGAVLEQSFALKTYANIPDKNTKKVSNV